MNIEEKSKLWLKSNLVSDADKETIDTLFKNGMYVEGYVKLTSTLTDGINLNIPFLAFYGDWTQAPMFDKTFYEVEADKYDNSILDDDKTKYFSCLCWFT